MKGTLKKAILKVSSLIMSVLMLVSVANYAVYADDTTVIASGYCGYSSDTSKTGENLTWTLDSDGILTIGGVGAMSNWFEIDPGWKEYANSIKKVVIENGVTNITDYTICSDIYENLMWIEIPDSVTEIEDTALATENCAIFCSSSSCAVSLDGYSDYCITEKNISGKAGKNLNYSLDKDTMALKFKGSGSKYSDFEFIGETLCRSVDISEWDYGSTFPSFTEYRNLISFGVPYGVATLNEDEFAGCISLKSITIPNSVKYIKSYAFLGCESLESVVIPNSVTTIGYMAFHYCSSLKEITISNNLTELGGYAFDGTSLEEIVLPKTLSGLETSAVDIETLKNLYILGAKTTLKAYDTLSGETVIHGYSNAKKFVEELNQSSVTYSNLCDEGVHYNSNYVTTKATTSKNGKLTTKCAECGHIESTSVIYSAKTISLSKTSFTYSGKVQKPTITIKDSNGNVISTSNYSVSYSSGCKNVGAYTAKITFKNYYSGTVSKTFTIVPKTTSLKSLSASSKGFTAKWNKQATQTTGYQIQYSTNSKFTNAKSVTVSSNSTTSKAISKLSGNKKYYVRIRTYKTVSKKNYYSSWSTAKTVTTKK